MRNPKVEASWIGLMLAGLIAGPLLWPTAAAALGWWWLLYAAVTAYVATGFVFWLYRWWKAA